MKACVRCYWVWFSPEVLSALASGPSATTVLDGPRALLAAEDRSEPTVAAAEARRVIGVLGADALRPAFTRSARRRPA